MGACMSLGVPQHIIEAADGDENDYQKRYLEDQTLGEGEFGLVKMVHDVTIGPDVDTSTPFACKILRKGMVFKDNTVYSPIKPEVLRGEIEILRTLRGKHYCLKLYAIYESPRTLYMVTEYCSGGAMIEYVSKLKSDLRSEDASRIAHQLISAVNHCYMNQIIHRDIKPENIMFQNPLPNSELRLIDFGSGVIDHVKKARSDVSEGSLIRHTTFAGSAFYISPEMFQRDYTAKTDVWSVGVVLYVLVAGYPADCLQLAFNVLQTQKRDLRTQLPNLPTNMPDCFYDLLEKLLEYKHTKRVTSDLVLHHEFVTFHSKILTQPELTKLNDLHLTQQPQDQSTGQPTQRGSVKLEGSVVRHLLILDFKKFERSLTTLLAAMLSKDDLQKLLDILKERRASKQEVTVSTDGIRRWQETVPQTTSDGVNNNAVQAANALTRESCETNQTLSVCNVSELKQIIQNHLQNESVLETIERLPNSALYNNYAYHISLLVVFSSGDQENHGEKLDSSRSSIAGGTMRRRQRRSRSFRRANSYTGKSISGGAKVMTGSNRSINSNSSRKSNFGSRAFFDNSTHLVF